MGLDLLLVKLDLLADRVNDTLRPQDRADPDLMSRFQGIPFEAAQMTDAARGAMRSMRRGEQETPSAYVGAFAAHAKNLADDLSLFLQYRYGSLRPELTRLAKNTREAPLTAEGVTLAQRYSQVHPDRVVMGLRHARSHGEGHSLVGKTADGYAFDEDIGTDEHPRTWVRKKAQDYLSLGVDCLDAVAGHPRIGIMETARGLGEIYRQRHKRGAMVALVGATLGAGILGGIGGTIAYQEIRAATAHADEMRGEKARLQRAYALFYGKAGSYRPVDSWEAEWAQDLLMDAACEEFEQTQKLGLLSPILYQEQWGAVASLRESCAHHYNVKHKYD